MDRTFLHVMSVFNGLFLVFVFLVIADTEGPGASCVPEIKVLQNTDYSASSESMLNISCPVTYCEEIPHVGWIKIDNTSKFIHITETNQVTITQEQTGSKDITSYLSFRNISTDDNGIYRCMISTSNVSSESHNINVNVSVPIMLNETQLSWIPYTFICLGILLLLVTVMLISSLSKCRYRCPTKIANHQIEYSTVVYSLVTSSPEISACHA